MQKNTMLAGMFLTALLVTFAQPAFAQYDAVEKGIYQQMQQSQSKVDIATRDGAIGAGVPVFAADGVLGASILSVGIFGGIAASFFIRGRKGKYAAMGRG